MSGLFLLIGTLFSPSASAAERAPSPAELREALARIESVPLSFRAETPALPGEAELGRLLFFDPRLSRERAMSCASCHQPALAWTDGLPKARGKGHEELLRNTPSLFDVAERAPFFRDGRAPSLEAQALAVIQDRRELDLTLPELEARLKAVPEYLRRFREVYGAAPEAGLAARAIASFERGLRSPRRSPFDAFREGRAALPPAAARGLVLFSGKARCVLCHSGPDLTDGFFHNTGHGRESPPDPGRFSVVPIDYAFRAFKTPSLREIVWTAPYFHDGRLEDLRSVVEFYDRGGDDAEERDALIEPLGLTAREKRDLVAFLESLSSPLPAVSVPVLPLELGAGEDAPAAARAPAPARPETVAAIERAVQEKRRALEKAKTGTPECLADVESRARRLAYGPPASGAAGERALSALEGAWERCAALNGWAEPAGGPVEEALARAQRRVDEAPEAFDAAACRAGFSPDALERELKDAALDPELRDRLMKASLEDLVQRRAYAALASGRAQDCAPLRGLERVYNGIQADAEAACVEWAAAMRFSRALMTRSPDWPEACRESLRRGYRAMPEADAAALCGRVAEGVDRPGELCAGLSPRWLEPGLVPACVAEFSRYARGGPEPDCSSIVAGEALLRGRCEALVAYRRASRGGGTRDCAGSELCLALAGDVEGPMSRLQARAASFSCALKSRSRNALRRAALAAARAEAEAARAALEARERARPAGSREGAAALDALAERAARLERRAAGLLEALPVEETLTLDPMAPLRAEAGP